MMDMQATLEKLRAEAAEAALIRDLATDKSKRELFARLSTHLAALATEVERAIATHSANEK
ncbi:hypothetical protein [Bradyrhizobium sp.]|uniref:hypothetical protein n=1 Tax=Bradyrhizobium sp. TaxID=376 RepID=UPI003C556E1E